MTRPSSHHLVQGCLLDGCPPALPGLLILGVVHELYLRLGDGRYVLVRRHGKDYVICMTRPNPNLGLVNLVLDALLSKR
jgi:hypothetical protein